MDFFLVLIVLLHYECKQDQLNGDVSAAKLWDWHEHAELFFKILICERRCSTVHKISN